MALKFVNILYVVFRTCLSVVIKKLNQAKLRFVLVEEKTLAVLTLTNLKKSFCKKLEAEVFISWRNKVLKAEKEFNQRVRIASMVRFALMKFV